MTKRRIRENDKVIVTADYLNSGIPTECKVDCIPTEDSPRMKAKHILVHRKDNGLSYWVHREHCVRARQADNPMISRCCTQ